MGPIGKSAPVLHIWRAPPKSVSIRASLSKRGANAVLFSVLFVQMTLDWQVTVLFAF